MLWAERSDGEGALLDHGRFVAAWDARGAPPLVATADNHAMTETPSDVAVAEEARLVWKWLDDPAVRIVDSSRPLLHTLRRPVRLERLAG